MSIVTTVTTIRKGLGIRGNTEHTGRGAYWMHSTKNLTWPDVRARYELALPKWEEAGLIESVETKGEEITITFVEKFGYYRKAYLGPKVMNFRNVIAVIGMKW